jgi:type I restriction enzyme S subunit
MREDWVEILYKDAVLKTPTSKEKLKQKEYSQFGEYPVVDQGQKLIGGYSNDSNRLLDCKLPVIVFGDHSKCVKLINFKFIPGADGTKILQPKSYIEPKYIFYLTQILVKKIENKGYARHYQYLEKENLPLAPLPQQRAIVAKIEELFSDLDRGIANLNLAKDQLKVYRQAVLKKAFEGELTKEWREKQTNLPTAGELLEQIKEERQKHFDKQIEDWKSEVKTWEKKGKEGKKPVKPRQTIDLSPLLKEDLDKLPILPTNFAWTQLGHVVWSVKDGPHYSPKYSKSGIPFISGGNIKPRGIDFENVKYISPELHNELSKRCKPAKNDLLYTKGGTTGIARVNTYDIDFNVWVHVAVLKAVDSIYPFYLQHVLNSSHCYQQSQKYTHGVGNQDLGLTRMILITLPICSKEEQHQIVREIESRLSVCDKVEQSITESLEKAKALRQSILKKAFEGTLLSVAELAKCKEAPDYEPASVLLERIKADKKK